MVVSETFVEKLISYKVSPAIRYHVVCLSDESTGNHFDYKGAGLFYGQSSKARSCACHSLRYDGYQL